MGGRRAPRGEGRVSGREGPSGAEGGSCNVRHLHDTSRRAARRRRRQACRFRASRRQDAGRRQVHRRERVRRALLLLRHQRHPHRLHDASTSAWGRRRRRRSTRYFKIGGVLLPARRRDRVRRVLGEVPHDHDLLARLRDRLHDRRARAGQGGAPAGARARRLRHRRHQAMRVDERRRPVHEQEPAPHRARVQPLLPGHQRRLVDLHLLLPRPARQVRPDASRSACPPR